MSRSQSQTTREPQEHPVDADVLRSLPPSSKLVLKVLEREGTMTQTTLSERTRLPRRTVRDALDRLDDIGVIQVRPSLRDARQSLYSLTNAS